MSSSTSIEHQGIIESISAHKINVRFTALSACVGCHARSGCSAADMQEKKVEITSPQGNFSVGEPVNIYLAPTQGFKAVLIGYIYPFLIVFIALITFSIAGIKELYSGIFSLSLLLPYYLLVYSLRKKLNSKFEFIIRKIE